MTRIGLFGGTFDPPHLGHLAIAEAARERLALDRVLFIPSGIPPHKRARDVSPAPARVEMTRLAIGDHPAFEVSTLEARKPRASYTVETLHALREKYPRARFFLVIGEDSLDDFPTWREPGEILSMATLAVARRPAPRRGSRAPAASRTGASSRGHSRRGRSSSFGARSRVIWLDAPSLELSSREIRARVRAGRSVRYLVPPRVAAYIDRRGLYRGRR